MADDNGNKEPNKEPDNKEPDTSEPEQDWAGSFEELKAEIASLKEAVAAIANAGAVNASVAADNGDDDYPEMDLDEVNRMRGA